MNTTVSERLLRIHEVIRTTSLARSTILLWVAQGKFPKPLSLSPTVKVWRTSDIDAWIEKKVQDQAIECESIHCEIR